MAYTDGLPLQNVIIHNRLCEGLRIAIRKTRAVFEKLAEDGKIMNFAMEAPVSRILKRASRSVMAIRFTYGIQRREADKIEARYYMGARDAVDICPPAMLQVS